MVDAAGPESGGGTVLTRETGEVEGAEEVGGKGAGEVDSKGYRVTRE